MEQLNLGLKEAVKPRKDILHFEDSLIIETEDSVFLVPDTCNISHTTPEYLSYLKENSEYTPLKKLKNVYKSKSGSIIIIEGDKAFEFFKALGWKRYTHEGFLKKYVENPDSL